jgi:hypothetical protein
MLLLRSFAKTFRTKVDNISDFRYFPYQRWNTPPNRYAMAANPRADSVVSERATWFIVVVLYGIEPSRRTSTLPGRSG